jgi:hypothetical protein
LNEEGGTMTTDEIARRLCEHSYLKLCDATGGKNENYSLEEYWEKNKTHYIERAEIYIEVKECLEAK